MVRLKEMGNKISQKSAGDIGGNRGTEMQTTALAGEIANYAIYQLKNHVVRISEMEILEQEDVRDIIRNAALHILNEFVRTTAMDHVEA
jgi:hypothetical protein